jgi:hypothetical protein
MAASLGRAAQAISADHGAAYSAKSVASMLS